MSASLDHFSRGLAKAFERRAKERTKQQTIQTVQNVAADAVTSDAIITTQQDHDELYRTTIVQNMIALIHKRKMK